MKTFAPSRRTGRRIPTLALAAISLAGLSLQATGCGKQAYVTTSSQAQALAPGKFTVPPKVDILLVQDDTGSSMPIFKQISSQLGDFLAQLQTQGWDYHLATIPLTTYRAISQVQASKFDPNWGSQWVSPYPGAAPQDVGPVTTSYFRTPEQYSDFLTGADTSTALNGGEPGLATIYTMLKDSSMTQSGFLRPDALLAVVVLSTGDDTSNRNFCSGQYARTDGYEGSCDLIDVAINGSHPSIVCGQPGAAPAGKCNNYQSSLGQYQTALKNIKGAGKSNQVRFYSVVSPLHQVMGGNCMGPNGANALIGARYQAMAGFLNGQTYDICTVPIPSALQGVASNLATVELSFYTSYLFMAQRPEPSSIVVYRNPGGDASKRVLIGQDANNGWTDAGEVTSVYTTAIGSPSAAPTLNMGSGWAVQLHGSAIIGGADTATVEFTPYGLQNNAAK